jgi:large subunit ribosomal protein L5
MTEFKKEFEKKVRPAVMKEFGYKNALAVPSIEKVVLNIGLSKALQDKKWIDVAVDTLTRITGQKPVLTKAKKSISNFKIREGMVVGAMVTLRGKKMYDFLQKMAQVTFPRMRDFHGLDPKKGFDSHGGYSIGFSEHTVFPEIKSDEVESLHGLELSIKTTAPNTEQTLFMLRTMGFPFKKL